MSNSDLPFGSEFSPSQIDLPELLVIAKEHSGNNKTLDEAILARYFLNHAQGNKQNQNKLAMNCRLGMKAYGLIDKDSSLTAFGETLYGMRSNQELLYTELARHILLNLKGMAFIQCIQDMIVAGEDVNLTSLRDALAERGIHYPSGGKHPSMMRLWLAKAGIFVGERWQVDSTNTGTEYCIQTGPPNSGIYGDYLSGNEQKNCLICDSRDPSRARPPDYLTDFNQRGNLTWWQSETMLEGTNYPSTVNLTLNLGKNSFRKSKGFCFKIL